MISEEMEKYIREKLSNKGINKETQNYVIKYVYLNQKLFANSIDITKVIERIVCNLEHSILRFDKKNLVNAFLGRSEWLPYEKRIQQDPTIKLLSFVSKKWRNRADSLIMHELDHCATTEYFNIDEKQEEEYIQQVIEKSGITKTKGKERIRNIMHKTFQEHNGILVICGISGFKNTLESGVNLGKLNEGITTYKQGLYDEFLGNKPYNFSYKVEKDVASFIADTIGKEKLIFMHFNNDYDGIREAFKDKTGKELNELVEKLNKKSDIKSMLFGDIYTKRFSKGIHTYMESIKGEQTIKKSKRNIDFIPKFQINYAKIQRNIGRNKVQQEKEI